MRHIVAACAKGISRTDVFFCALLWLMILLLAGTIAQKDVGLYAAQHTYFSTFIMWLGGAVPLPGGYSVMVYMFAALACKLFTQRWTRHHAGTLIIHVGALMLMLGGGITALFSWEGNMVIEEGTQTHIVSDYHTLELALNKKGAPAQAAFAFPHEALQQGAYLAHEQSPFTFRIVKMCRNCTVVPWEEGAPENAHALTTQMALKALPLEKENEMNTAGLVLEITGTDGADGLYTLIQDSPVMQHLQAAGVTYTLSLHNSRTFLPFSLELVDFEEEKYGGSNMAKAYSSDVLVHDGDVSWRSLIQMNEPLRYKGYTFYQASFIDGIDADTTVLAVVQNWGRIFPYVSSIVMCIGLLVHLVMRLPRLFRTRVVSIFVLMLGVQVAHAAPLPADVEAAFAHIPVQHEGRIKPLDTFARTFLLGFNGKEEIALENGEKMPATTWLVEVIMADEKAYQRRMFNIENPDVTKAIGLVWRPKHRYSFVEISRAMQRHVDVIKRLQETPESTHTKAQSQLLDVYGKTLMFFELNRSLSLFTPDFKVRDAALAQALKVQPNTTFSYIDMLPQRAVVAEHMQAIEGEKIEELTPMQQDVLMMGRRLQLIMKDQFTQVLRVVPSPWKKGEWVSPWATLQQGQGAPATARILQAWHEASLAYRNQNWAQVKQAIRAFAAPSSYASYSAWRLKLEVLYNTYAPFKMSLVAYLSAFLGVLAWALARRCWVYSFALSALGAGLLLHGVGVVARMVIMQRPPVATLYESVVFVGVIALLVCLLLERKRRDGLLLFVGALMGCVLQFIGLRYAAQGDTMGMLVAVLNTNFWLATHVVTISIGYAFCVVAGTLAHVYLVKRYLTPHKQQALAGLLKNIMGVALVALFFAVLGTILGGIWADQSWGRFWGWDPKENGAMLICLWLIWLVHGRLAGVLKGVGFAVGMVGTNAVVALAWFGVNLLGVGLHSYGFTENIFMNLMLFCAAEIAFGLTMWALIKHKEKGAAPCA